jgi:hypothetical protein
MLKPVVPALFLSTPQRNNVSGRLAAHFRTPFGALILRPGAPEFRADKPFLRCPNRVAE